MCTILKVFFEFVTVLLLFLFCFFGPEACVILTFQPGIKPAHPLHWKANFYPLDREGSPLKVSLKRTSFSVCELCGSSEIFPGACGEVGSCPAN